MNNNRLRILLSFICFFELFGDNLLDDKIPPCECPFMRPGEVDINIRTEKDSYCLGELITLEVEIINLTDRKIPVNNIPNYLIDYFGVEVLDPYRPQMILKKYNEIENSMDDYVIEEHKPSPVSRTRAGKQKQGWIKSKDYIIDPKGKLLFRLPLNLYFDFSNTCGTYIVNIDCDLLKEDYKNHGKTKRELVIKKSCKFKLKNEAITSVSRMTAEYMIETLGREKAIEVLCDEADALISGFMKMKEEEWRKSGDYARLKRILATSCWASDIRYYDKNLDYIDERNAMRLDEFGKLVQRCRARRLDLYYEEAEELLESLEEMDEGKWLDSAEYSRFKVLLNLLCNAAKLGYDDKNLEYLEKNNLMELEKISYLFHRCGWKLMKSIPFFGE